MRSDRRLTVRMIASKLNLNHTTVHQILMEELAMKKMYAKFVPKNLTIEQDNRKDVSSSSGTDPKGQKFLEERDYR